MVRRSITSMSKYVLSVYTNRTDRLNNSTIIREKSLQSMIHKILLSTTNVILTDKRACFCWFYSFRWSWLTRLFSRTVGRKENDQKHAIGSITLTISSLTPPVSILTIYEMALLPILKPFRMLVSDTYM